jgi:hypothetical protein
MVGILEHVVDGRVVDQHVEVAEAGQRRVAQGGHGGRICHVEGAAESGRRQCSRKFGAAVGVEIGDNDVGPVSGQRFAMLTADESQRAGDDGGFVVGEKSLVMAVVSGQWSGAHAPTTDHYFLGLRLKLSVRRKTGCTGLPRSRDSKSPASSALLSSASTSP